MAHKSLDELEEILNQMAGSIEIGGLYAHYKTPQQAYAVKDLVILESNDDVAVVYEPEENKSVKFVRPLSSWLEVVKHKGQFVPRFQKIISR